MQTVTNSNVKFDLVHSADILEDRDREIKEICNDMKEINKLFISVGELIDGQSEYIDSIQTNISNSHKNVNDGLSEIKKAEKCQNECVLF